MVLDLILMTNIIFENNIILNYQNKISKTDNILNYSLSLNNYRFNDCNYLDYKYLNQYCDEYLNVFSVSIYEDFFKVLKEINENSYLKDLIISSIPENNDKEKTIIEVLTFNRCFNIYINPITGEVFSHSEDIDCQITRQSFISQITFNIPKNITINQLKSKLENNIIFKTNNFNFIILNNSLIHIYNIKPSKNLILEEYWEKLNILVSKDEGSYTIVLNAFYASGLNAPKDKFFKSTNIDYYYKLDLFFNKLKLELR